VGHHDAGGVSVPVAIRSNVGGLADRLGEVLASSFADVEVSGVVRELTRASSGNLFFWLVGEGATLRCAFFRRQDVRCEWQVEEGVLLTARGAVTLHRPKGTLTLVVRTVRPPE
jgi:exodeoxyribonuclease VII large subunit